MSSGESMRNPNKLVGLRVIFGLCGLPDTDTDADEDDDIGHHSVAPRSPEEFLSIHGGIKILWMVGTYFVLSRTSRGMFLPPMAPTIRRRRCHPWMLGSTNGMQQAQGHAPAKAFLGAANGA